MPWSARIVAAQVIFIPDSMIRLGQRIDAIGFREEGLVLKIDIIEMVSIPKLLQAQRHAHGFEADPLTSIDERVGAERAAEIAALRGNVIELTLALELEITLDRNQSIVVRPELVDLRQRPRGILAN